MRAIGLIVSMLIVYWAANVFVVLFPFHFFHWRDFWFTLSFVLFFGTLVAAPWATYLFCAAVVIGRLRFPWNAIVYVVAIGAGCALYAAALRFWNRMPLPTTSEGWYFYWLRFIPMVATAMVPVIWRLIVLMAQRKKPSA